MGDYSLLIVEVDNVNGLAGGQALLIDGNPEIYELNFRVFASFKNDFEGH